LNGSKVLLSEPLEPLLCIPLELLPCVAPASDAPASSLRARSRFQVWGLEVGV